MSSRRRNPKSKGRRKLRETFIADQAEAAAEQAKAHLDVLGSRLGPAASLLAQQPAAQQAVVQIVEAFTEWRDAGLVGVCVHINPGAPAVAYWLPQAPGLRRCQACTAQAILDLEAKAAEPGQRHCSCCGELGLHVSSFLVAAGSTMILGDVCDTCAGESMTTVETDQ
jgi:hypothetical protein